MKLTSVKLNNKVITSNNKFNLLETKIFLFLCKKYQINEKTIQQKDLFKNIIFNTNDIYEILEIDYHNLKRSLVNLKKQEIILKDDKKTIYTSLIMKYTFFKSGELEIVVDKDLEELFKTIKSNYTILEEKQTYNLKYKHSLKLYMLMKKIEKQTYKRMVITLEVQVLIC